MNPPPDATHRPPSDGEAPRTPVAMEGAERVLEAIMFTDIEGSVRLEQTLGTARYAEVLTRHGEIFYEALSSVRSGHVEKHTGDGFMARFGQPSEAVAAALRFQWLLNRERWDVPPPLRFAVRIGLHQGEILLLPSVRQMPSTIGAPVHVAARVMSMAVGGQILLTRAVFDNARQFVREIPDTAAALRWEAHGSYLAKGIEAPIEVFEVGEEGRAPFTRPESSDVVQRSVSAEEEATLGWRPANGLEIPKRPGWFLQKQLGEGGFGEVWLAENAETRELRVFKFCFDVVRLRSFKREVLLFRLIREALGPRTDIATLYEVQLETAPFFLESEYCRGGILSDWIEERKARGGVPLAQRIEIVVKIARALAAAHSVGIIHKDVKPSNIFIEEQGGSAQPRLADFGIGVLTDRSALSQLDLTYTGDLTFSIDQSRTGTRMYSAPEYMIGRPPSIQGDIYSLGVLLYQMVIEDFGRPLGPGWQRDVADPLLAQDIAFCVDVEPERRFGSALQVAECLESLEARRRSVLEAEAAREREQEQHRKLETYRRRVRLALAGAAIALTLLGALSVVALVLHRARSQALEHTAELEKEREVSLDRLYLADMQATTDDVVQRRADATREVVNRHRPGAGEKDRRGWEWHYANAVLNTENVKLVSSAQPLRALAMNADETAAAVAGDDGIVAIWSGEPMTKVFSLPAGAPVKSLAWHPSGKLAAGLENGEVVLWDTPAAEQMPSRWKAHASAITTMAWHPREETLVTGGSDGLIAWWDRTGKPGRQVQRRGPIQGLDWRQDGSEIAVILGEPAQVLVSTADELQTAVAVPLDVESSPVAWRPGEYQVALAKRDSPLLAWKPDSQEDAFWLPSHFSAGPSAYAWSGDGKLIAVASVEGKILLLDSERLQEARNGMHGHLGRVTAMRWLSGGHERLLSVGEDGALLIWSNLRQSPELFNVPFPVDTTGAQWHPSEPKIAVCLAGDEVQVLESDTWKVQWSRPLPPPEDAPVPLTPARLTWSDDGRWLAVVSPGRPPVAWRLEDGTQFLPQGCEGATDLGWMPDSQRLLVRNADGWQCFRLEDGTSTLVPASKQAVIVAALPGNRIALVTGSGADLRFEAREFAAEKPEVECPLPVGFGAVRSSALNKNRTLLALGGESGAVLWINTQTGAISRPGMSHAGPVRALGWHQDGSRLASVGGDDISRIFNVPQVAQNWVVAHRLGRDVTAVGWDASGRKLSFAAGPGKQLKIYDASNSFEREPAGTAQRAAVDAAAQLAAVCESIRHNPGEAFGWTALNEIVRSQRGEGDNSAADLLLAAAELGAHARFSPFTPAAGAAPLRSWQGTPLPHVVQVAQACALAHWKEVLALCDRAGPDPSDGAWLRLARAEALRHLGRRDESEKANLDAWRLLRIGANDPRVVTDAPPILTPRGSTSIDLSQFANVKLTDDWTGGKENNLSKLPPALWQPEGFALHTGPFVQLAGKAFRAGERGSGMLPRSTGWMPSPQPASQLSFLLGTTFLPAEKLKDSCPSSLFLLRRGGGGAVRVPLIYGRDVWDWWTPPSGNVSPAPPERIAWIGSNAVADKFGRGLALYRFDWKGEEGDEPIIAVSFVSHMRGGAPMLISAEAWEAAPVTSP